MTVATFWGKAHPAENSPSPMHPLVAHSLDVAAVAMLLPHPTVTAIPRQTLGFLVALHDVGKFSRPFQAKEPMHWPAALGAFPAVAPTAVRHDALSLHLLREDLAAALDSVLPPSQITHGGWPPGDRVHVLQALAGHHGRPVARYDGRLENVLCSGCRNAARAFVAAMATVFHPVALYHAAMGKPMARLGWDLAGLVTLADWIGSRQSWFPYASIETASDPARYFWDHALPRAAAALAASGLASAAASPFRGVRRLFPGIAAPSPVQSWAETAALPPGPLLAVIEDVTGSGKTEAAVALTHRLLSSGQASGVFFALPTMATANAMFGRMADAYRGLFLAEARPSLVLAHGRAGLDPRFAAMMTSEIGGNQDERLRGADPADIPAEAHCAAWLAEDRRRALMAQVGVGTIDQALLAVLPVRHAVLRQQGLKGKVLVVDEAHAFDPYMQRELVELLRFHAALGGSAILLSATLPHAVRQRLADAFRSGLGARPAPLTETAYPLATLVDADGATEAPCPIRDGLARQRGGDVSARMPRRRWRGSLQTPRGRARPWPGSRNTVDDAICDAAEALSAEGSGSRWCFTLASPWPTASCDGGRR